MSAFFTPSSPNGTLQTPTYVKPQETCEKIKEVACYFNFSHHENTIFMSLHMQCWETIELFVIIWKLH